MTALGAVRYATAETSLGSLLVAATGAGVCAVALGDAPGPLVTELLSRHPHAAPAGGELPALAQVIERLERPGPAPAIALDLRGTTLQLEVWRALREVELGGTVAYSELAALARAPHAVRAVAAACAANVVAVLVPCHRAVGKDGALTGYRWGLARKRELLARERAAAGGPFTLQPSLPGFG